MSFSRAKRFVYKSPDVESSPADYLFSLGLEKGCSIPKSSRFRKSKNGEDNQLLCSRMSYTCGSEHINGSTRKCNKTQSKNVDNEKYIEFNRNNALRKSIKARRKNDVAKTIQCNTDKHQNDRDKSMSMYESEEFIDDDYGSMTSSEDLYDLKNVEDYEFNEVYSAIKRIQQRKCPVPAKTRAFNFEDTVLKKLDVIDRNVKIIKEDITYSPTKTPLKQLHYQCTPNTENTDFKKHCHPLKTNQEHIKNIIMEAIQKLSKDFQYKTKSIQKINEKHVLNMIAEIYTTNNKSNKQIKELCNITAEELVENLNNVFQISTCCLDCASENETENMWEELTHCFNEKNFYTWNSGSLQNLISDYLEQTQEVGQELEEDISDITLRCTDTQQMLDVQGAILDKMKSDIENLKSDLFVD